MSALLLVLDTVGSRCAVGVYDMDAARLLASAEPDIGRGHAERLMDIASDVLAEARVSYADLARIAVMRGPGSFTGLRVGVAAAKGLSLALSIPAVGVSTLEALAEPHWKSCAAEDVLCVIDAKRGELYAALFACEGTVLREAEAIEPPSLAGWVAEAKRSERGLVLVGTGARIAAALLSDPHSRLELPRPAPPRVSNEAGLVDLLSIARLGAMADPARGLSPLYLRGADAKPQAQGLIRHSAAPAPFGEAPVAYAGEPSSILT